MALAGFLDSAGTATLCLSESPYDPRSQASLIREPRIEDYGFRRKVFSSFLTDGRLHGMANEH